MVQTLSQACIADPRAHLGPGCEDFPGGLQQLEQQGVSTAVGCGSLELQVFPGQDDRLCIVAVFDADGGFLSNAAAVLGAQGTPSS